MTESAHHELASGLANSEYAIWFTTVDSKNVPHVRPVWFIYDNDHFLIYSQPTALKLKHIKNNPNVLLHFNSDPIAEEQVVIYAGLARIVEDHPRPLEMEAYMRKYKEGIERIGYTAEGFNESYSVAIQVQVLALRGG